MPTFTLPDGAQKSYDDAVTGFDIAKELGIAKKALAIEVDGCTLDLSASLSADAAIRILMPENDDPAVLSVLRHSCAHVLAEAVCELFPGTKLAYGPSLDDGFYYDMATPQAITVDDFQEIEKKMKRIVKENRKFIRCDYSPADGLKRTEGDKYKTDNAERAIERGSDTLSFYVTGNEGTHFEDLCAGPHVPSTGKLKAFKITAVSGAYWHGDQSSDQLTRIYGTCFADREGLDAHLKKIEEAKKRDHRKIGKEMQLFHIDEDNPGQIFWHHNGWSIYRKLVDFVREKVLASGYIEVKTPPMMPKTLWEKSGHWAKYRENMFITWENVTKSDGSDDADSAEESAEKKNEDGAEVEVKDEAKSTGADGDRVFALKPMNCPGHIEIFKQHLHSYRDLPLRMSEFGSCTRFEPSGALHGIMRVRGFVQDDAHIFCTEAQIAQEVADFCELLKEVYDAFGFTSDKIAVKFSTRPDVRVGSDESWDRAEAALEDACKLAGLQYDVNPGEGAFYGPKLEFVLTDCLAREWQCGTIQVDYQLPSSERLNACYVGEDGEKHNPVMLHRAILGSLERFIGILIEEYAGKFPLWLAPEQVRILPVVDDHQVYAQEVSEALNKSGLHTTWEDKSDKLGAKIRNARNARVNYFAVVGAEEIENKTVSLQRQDGSKLGSMSVDELLTMLKAEVAAKTVHAE
ncbi:MAG: threonine--tRNA ligase [Planctomycetes bacterium]|nr:threonine--tRNA ligase [Planctomycetota bacterium]